MSFRTLRVCFHISGSDINLIFHFFSSARLPLLFVSPPELLFLLPIALFVFHLSPDSLHYSNSFFRVLDVSSKLSNFLSYFIFSIHNSLFLLFQLLLLLMKVQCLIFYSFSLFDLPHFHPFISLLIFHFKLFSFQPSSFFRFLSFSSPLPVLIPQLFSLSNLLSNITVNLPLILLK